MRTAGKLGVVFLFATWAAQTLAQTGPIPLKVVQEYVEAQPRIGRATGISLVGVVAERGSGRAASLNADLLLPALHRLDASSPVCIHARSQDARFSFQGEAAAGLPSADAGGRLRVQARMRPESTNFLRTVDLAQFALLARMGPCAPQVGNEDVTPIIIAMDPLPEAGAQFAALRVLLNAPEGRVSLAFGPKGATKVEQTCQRSTVKEAGAFATECRITPPATDLIEVEIRRHRFNNKPLVDRFDLIGPANPQPRG